MEKRASAILIVLVLLSSLVFGVTLKTPLTHAISNGNLTSQEAQVTAAVNGTSAYNFDLELERIALRHYAFRSGGSTGANETANWIRSEFEGLGLESWLEPFQFATWDLMSKPSLILDPDGNPSTISDQIQVSSFQSEHLSWHTPPSGVFAPLVTLPLPLAANRGEVGINPIDMAAWDGVNTTGKVVMIGEEVRWSDDWLNAFVTKILIQRPMAVVYTWWYSWMSFTPASYGSAAGQTLWTMNIPVGSVNYADGLQIRSLGDSPSLWARMTIDSVMGNGTHYNVVGRIRGSTDPDKIIVVSSHYDTVMTAGFCDNGAGTAGVLELARVFSYMAKRGVYAANYTLFFVTFTSEEFWLVGSVNFVRQHKSDMTNIAAVINLDCIGNDHVSVSETSPSIGLDLDQTMVEAASDLGILATLEQPEGSDHETFLNPAGIGGSYQNRWGINPMISDASPVGSSSMIISYPLQISEKWSGGTPGWIHTSYDNSTSTQTLNWVTADNLEKQVRMAGLTVLRVQSPGQGSPDANGSISPWLIAGLVVVVVFAAVVVGSLVRARRSRAVVDAEGAEPEPGPTG